MPRLQTRQALADMARVAATSLDLVEYQDVLYAPVDFETGAPGSSDPERTIWKRQSLLSVRHMANNVLDVLFSSDGEFRSFTFMLKQFAELGVPDSALLVPVKRQGVRRLSASGTLSTPTGQFVSGTLGVEYDPEVDTSHVWETLCGWLSSEDQAHALLRHLSVGLQPWWTSSKYLLFIGNNGSNGKSTLLKMLYKLFGEFSVSQVTRQQMATNRPVVKDLNGAILNIVFDGSKKFLSDSSSEKTLIAGEPLSLELKYENIPVIVQTKALFLEGLNHEPRMGDHSGAIQRRLERFHFPNQYAKNLTFERTMLSNKSLSALLKLILEHWVHEDMAGKELESTTSSRKLQLDSVLTNNPVFQYMEFLAVDPEEFKDVVSPGALFDPFLTGFRQWANESGYRNYDDAYLKTLVDEAFLTVRKTVRLNGKPSTRRVIVEWKPIAKDLIEELTGDI